MSTEPLPRRSVLQTGALAAGTLTLGGLGARTAQAAPDPAAPLAPLSGALAAWVRLESEGGAEIRLVQLGPAGQPVRKLAGARLSEADLGGSGPGGGKLRRACAGAEVLTREVAARSWGVPAAACATTPGRIACGDRAVRYTVWVDVI